MLAAGYLDCIEARMWVLKSVGISLAMAKQMAPINSPPQSFLTPAKPSPPKDSYGSCNLMHMALNDNALKVVFHASFS